MSSSVVRYPAILIGDAEQSYRRYMIEKRGKELMENGGLLWSHNFDRNHLPLLNCVLKYFGNVCVQFEKSQPRHIGNLPKNQCKA